MDRLDPAAEHDETPPPRKGWWGRNWKWAVPVGCLAPLLVIGGCVATVIVMVPRIIRSSEPYRHAVAEARASAAVKAVLGEPIEEGALPGGNINVSGSTGDADLSIPISGPKGSATLYIVGKKTAGEWEYSTLRVKPDGDAAAIDLVPAERPAPRP
jgi:hypothetical protein